MAWAFLYMMVILKIPLAMALWIVWWAVRDEPAPKEERTDDGGGPRRPPHPRHRPPRPSRRGPHAEPPPRSPKRVRATARRLAPTRR